MMKRRSAPDVYGRMVDSSATTSSAVASGPRVDEEVEWEMRPGGMLVQQRSMSTDVSVPNLRLRVTHGAIRLEISVNSQATFGEVKKLLAAETGLQPVEQRLIFRGRERENREYLDICGVKDRSKVILVQDPASIERRFIEMRRNAKIQSAHRAVSDVSVEVDQLTEQVSSIEKSIANGNKVPEVQIATLTEMLMRQAIKLDSISAEGDVVSLKNIQEKRIQECVEILDVLKLSNARVKPVIVTTKWETFDTPLQNNNQIKATQWDNSSLIDL
ncbi:BAG family molecular chaperone regulator 2-like [Punica granatum]|uniref:Ubiquitin-like domain-containing protein n=2 Tax=Punica granatum TaxID=22663 RepID=A0A218VU08_PUNGR|nr:BAG family molecular chaperone regulator 2-like [Punica granatum]OWM63833.1 hypothetical protein CDL15_Pgr006095 [Punica granatum]PKI68103.1 hypothetical protein CRG98_011699 [Punica granatum]